MRVPCACACVSVSPFPQSGFFRIKQMLVRIALNFVCEPERT